ncbi:hypothetical protein IAD21_00597 [Abditibacteriota bacterium]|nr:hypothetical protein IAD21_00597 [Abditibacteriota bacterium]
MAKNPQTIARKGYDYNGLPDRATRATLRQEAAAIKMAVKRTNDNIIEIGNRLIHSKEVAGHGEFLKWIDAEFGASYDEANDLMNVAKAFSNLEISPNLTLSKSALFALSAPGVTDETRASAIEKAASGEIKTVADVKAHIGKSRSEIPTSSDEFIAISTPPVSTELEPAPEDPTFTGAIEWRGQQAYRVFSDGSRHPIVATEPLGAALGIKEEYAISQIDPFADEVEADAGSEALASDPASPYFSDSETLDSESSTEGESKNLGGETSEPEKKPEPTVEEKIRQSPLGLALAMYGHQGYKFVESALMQEDFWKKITAIHAIAGRLRHATNATADTLAPVARFAHWSKWEGCPACKGSGRFGERKDPCATCKTWGFVIIPETGVSPDVVSEHAESLNAESI